MELAANFERSMRMLRRDISKLELQEAGKMALESADQVVPFETLLLEAEGYLKEFLSAWNERSNLQGKIKDDAFPSDTWYKMYDEIRQEIRQAKISLATIQSRRQPTTVQAEVVCQAHTLNTSVLGRSNLPKISIPKFSGDLLSWRHFKDTFESIVHNDPALSEIEKFHYLLGALSGEASSIISGYPVEKESYQQAWEKLLSTYNNSRVLAKLYVQRILDSSVKHIHDEEKRYTTFLSTVAESVDNFNRLNLEKPEEFILSILALRALDEGTRRMFELSWNSDEEFPTVKEVIQFVSKRMTALKLAKDPTSSGSGSFYRNNPRGNSPPAFRRYPRQHGYTNAVALHTSSSDSIARVPKQVHFESKGQRRDRTPSRNDKHPRPSASEQSPMKRSDVCPFCNGAHLLPYCPKFHEAVLQDRIDFVKGWKGCTNCLITNHTLSQCKSKWSCRYCREKHHSLIHQERRPSFSGQQSSSEASKQGNCSVNPETFTGFGSTPSGTSSSMVLLGTLQALIQGKDHVIPVRAILDSGSQHTFITKSLADKLQHPISRFNAHVTGLGGASVSQPMGVIDCSIKSFCDTSKFDVNAVIVKKISPSLPSTTIEEDKIKTIIAMSELADHSFNTPGSIDLLLGMDIYPLVVKGAPRRAGVDDLFFLPTTFGLVMIGSVNVGSPEPTSTAFFTESCQEISTNLKAFWEIEEPAPVMHRDPNDLHCEQHFVKTHSRDNDGRYIVRLPVKANSSSLPPNRDLAARRFSCIESKMSKDVVLSTKYKEFMKEYEDLGHMSLAATSSGYIIPHHGVWQQRPEGPKLRVVFDASCGPESLNDALLPGPKLQSDISNILINFRTYVIPVCTDIVKMYRQILLHPEDRHLQHIFWRNEAAEALHEYELNTVTYGVRPSAFLAMRVIQQLVADEGSNYPLAADRVCSSMYVDDIVSGANTMDEAMELKQQLIELFAKGGFSLSKWATTAKELLTEDEDETYQLHIVEQDAPHQKILGLMWSPSKDVFSYVVHRPQSTRITKRIILSAIARIFDPLGLLAPITFRAKVLLQEVWKSRADWDEPLTGDIVDVWLALTSEWHIISKIEIPRYFSCYDASCQVIGFCDASEKGYAASVYLRAEHSDGSVHVTLMKSKTKVAPLKFVSIARLELCGALLLTKLLSSLNLPSLSVKPPVCFTDSTVVLAWLRKPAHELKVFEANRVTQVLSTTSISDWRHVRSEDNPADIGSRGCSPGELYEANLWWNGPSWLSRPCKEWPHDNGVVEKVECMMAVRNSPDKRAQRLDDRWMERFSSYRTLVRTVARILRLTKGAGSTPGAPIAAGELHDAQMRCVRLAQLSHLPKAMMDNNLVPKPYDQLNPFIDDQGIVRVGGRLDNAPLTASSRHPILIPKNCHLAQLIVDDLHQRHFHAGPTLVLALLRQEYWISGAVKFIRGRILRCVSCRMVRSKPVQPMMSSLPPERFNQYRAFIETGLDYAGPFLIKESTRRNAAFGKAYLCIFVCMATKAVHLEAVSSLSTPAFLSALDRFVARRGISQKLHSDHGSNFIGASRFLKDVYKFIFKNEATIIEYLAPRKIQWRFIPPGTPHFGGLWEAGVKSVKTLLIQGLGKHPYTFEEFSTALAKIEGLLNSRPMYALNENVDDCDYLTPGHFLIGSSLSHIPDPSENLTPNNNSSRWQALKNQVRSIWNRWRMQYLHSLQQRKKWTRRVPNLQQGDLVILLEKKAMPGHWPVARVEQDHPGKDGITRVVTVRTPSGKTFVRSASSLVPLFPLEAEQTPSADN